MNQKNRLLFTLLGKDHDRAPVICPGGMMNMVTQDLQESSHVYLPAAHEKAQDMAKLAEEVAKLDVFDNVGVPFDMTIEAEGYGAVVDLGNDIYEPHVIEYPIKTITEWRRLTPMDLNKGRAQVVLEALQLLKKNNPDVAVIGNLTGPVSVVTSVIEPVYFYKALRKNNEEAHQFMDFVTKDLIAFAKAMIQSGADVIAISDPSGTGEILGPKLFEEFCVTYLNKVIDEIKKEGVPVIVHICGQMKSVYEQVNHVRSDALSFDSIVPIKEAKAAMPGRIIMGNVSTYALEYGEADRIKGMTKACLKSGSDIISPACGLGMRTKLDRLKAMKEAVREAFWEDQSLDKKENESKEDQHA